MKKETKKRWGDGYPHCRRTARKLFIRFTSGGAVEMETNVWLNWAEKTRESTQVKDPCTMLSLENTMLSCVWIKRIEGANQNLDSGTNEFGGKPCHVEDRHVALFPLKI